MIDPVRPSDQLIEVDPFQHGVEVHAVEINMDVHSETPEDDQDYALVVYGVTDFEDCSSSVSVPTITEYTLASNSPLATRCPLLTASSTTGPPTRNASGTLLAACT